MLTEMLKRPGSAETVVKNLVFNTKPIGIRKFGRLKLRWEDVIQDIKTLGVKNRRNLTMEKD
jgi:hypothetical protein